MEVERGLPLERDGGDEAGGPEADAGGLEQLGLLVERAVDELAVSGDDAQASDLGRKAAHRPPGAMGRGRDRAGDRLVGNVAEVRQRVAELPELGAQLLEPDASLHRHRVTLRVGVIGVVIRRARDEPVVIREVDQVAVRQRDRGERMAGADRLHALAALHGASDDGDQLLLGTWPVDPQRGGGLVAGPVGPARSLLLGHRSFPSRGAVSWRSSVRGANLRTSYVLLAGTHHAGRQPRSMQLIRATRHRVVAASSTAPRRVVAEDAGQTIVLFTAAMLGLVGMMAIVIDVAIRSEERRQLQNAADAAALAAVSLLPSDPAGAELLAITYLDKNGVDVTDPNVSYNFEWPVDGNPNQAAVTVVRERSTLFAGAFGIDKMRPDATAIAERITPEVGYALLATGTDCGGADEINVGGTSATVIGGVHSNATSMASGS